MNATNVMKKKKVSRDSSLLLSNDVTNKNGSDEVEDLSTNINYTGLVNESSIVNEEISPI